MERLKLDNGLLLIAFISNIIGLLGITICFGIRYLMDPVNEQAIILIPLALFTLISALMVIRFRKIEFDDQYVYLKNVFNKELDSFPVKNITGVKTMVLGFNTRKASRMRRGRNYRITYLDRNGVEKKARVMATVDSKVVNEFKRATAFLGADGFRPE
jgi:hypothetical protein